MSTQPDRQNVDGLQDRVAAISRRFSPDMELRWLPTFAGKVIVGGPLPFSGFDTRDEALAAAQEHAEHVTAQQPARDAAEGEDWKDDPSADERWQAGLDFGMEQLCATLGVDPKSVMWDAATETLDGDVSSVIWNILRAKMGDDWDPHAPPKPAPEAPGHTDLMVTPESVDSFMEKNPLPAPDAIPHSPPCTGAAEPGEDSDTFADMLWKWFEDRGCGLRSERHDGLSADNFKIMLDEHEAALTDVAPPVRGDREAIKTVVKLAISDGEYIGRHEPAMYASEVIALRTKCIAERTDAILSLPVPPGAGEREATAQSVMDSRNKQFGFAWDLNEAICDAIDGGKTESRDIAARVTTSPKIKEWLKLLPTPSRQAPHSSIEDGR